MYKHMMRQLFSCLLVVLFSTTQVMAFQDETLLTIDDKSWSVADFKQWWEHWQEKDMEFPETPDPYVDWLLMVREAEHMQLYESSAFRRKVDTFLKARSLMLLKGEEIDSKINITEQELEAEYTKDYAPSWQVVILYFRTPEEAARCSNDLHKGTLSVMEAIGLTGSEGGPITHLKRWVRPKDTPLPWQEVFKTMDKGDISDPVPGDQGRGAVVFNMVDKRSGDEQDYLKVRKGIERKLRKRQQSILTRELIEQLKVKFNVHIDQEVLEAIDPDSMDEQLLDRYVITTDKVNVTVRYFIGQLKRYKGANLSPEEKKATLAQEKQRVVNQMIGTSLTAWEALDRHYEETPLLQSSYGFYVKHRLVRELESRHLAEADTVSEQEIAAYYENHRQEYMNPAMVRYLQIQGENKLVKKVWVATLGGADFKETAAKFGLEPPVDAHGVPDHFEQELRKAVEHLGVNEVSKPFTSNGATTLVKMLARKPAMLTPLNKVGEEISKQLEEEKFAKARGEYLDLLKKGVSISVNQSAWRKVLSEMKEKSP